MEVDFKFSRLPLEISNSLTCFLKSAKMLLGTTNAFLSLDGFLVVIFLY